MRLAGSLIALALDLSGGLPESRNLLRLAAASTGLLLIALMTTGVHFKLKLLRDELQQRNVRAARTPMTGAESPDPLPAEDDGPTNSNWNIGPRMEQKLQQALFYLKENFRSDISREGLAAQLELNPDNLGRFFLMYTGEKLGDYVNQLRIAAAARRLHESDQQIQSVAREVGFDNISTFNRVFKKVMGRTPRMYREELRQAAGDPP